MSHDQAATTAPATSPPQPKRYLNYQLALVLAVGTVAVGLGLKLLHYWQMGRHAERFLIRAEDELERGERQRGLQDLAMYLKFRPDDEQAEVRLALLQSESPRNDWEAYRALARLEGLVGRRPESRAARMRLIQLLLEFGRGRDAELHLTALRRANPVDVEVELLLGKAREVELNQDGAISIYEQLVEAVPTTVPAWGRLAELLRSRGDSVERVRDLLDQMLAANPESAEAWLIRTRDSEARSQRHAAFRELQQALELEPENPAALTLLVEIVTDSQSGMDEDRQKLRNDARERVDAAISGNPRDPQLYLARSRLDLVEGQFAAAEKLLESGLAACGDKPELILGLAEVQVASRSWEAAVQTLERVPEGTAVILLKSFVEAQVEMGRGDWTKATSLLSSVRANAKSRPDLLIEVELALATCARELHHDVWLADAYRRAVVINSHSAEARSGLARSLEAEGNWEGATDAYRQLMDDAEVESREKWLLPLIHCLVRANALRSPEIRVWEEVRTLLAAYTDQEGESAATALLSAEVQTLEGDRDRAEQSLSAACTKYPDSRELWLARLDNLLEKGDLPAFETALAETTGQGSLQRVALQARIRKCLLFADPQASQTLAELEKLSRGLPPQDLRATRFELASAAGILGDFDMARRLWQELAKDAPSDIALRRNLLQNSIARDSAADFAQDLAMLQELEGPHGVYWRLAEAQWALRRAGFGEPIDIDRVRESLQGAAGGMPFSPEVSIAFALLAELEGRTSESLDRLRDAIDRGANAPVIIVKALRGLCRRGQFLEAEKLLGRVFSLPGRVSASEAIRRAAAEVALGAGDFSLARRRGEQVVSFEQATVDDCLWTAILEESSGRADEAGKWLTRARELEPRDEAAFLAQLSWRMRRNLSEEARAALEEFTATIDEPRASLLRGQGLEILGRADSAAAAFAKALKQAPADPEVLREAGLYSLRAGRPVEAEKIWRMLLSLGNDSVARRGLATCLLARRDYPALREGLQLADENLSRGVPQAADLRLKAHLLAAFPSRENLRQVLWLLAKVGEQSQLTREDRKLLAEVHLRRGDWSATKVEIDLLLEQSPRDVEFLIFGLRAYLERAADDPFIEQSLATLERLIPGDPRNRELQIRGQVARRNLTAAQAQLLTAGDVADPDTAKSADDEARRRRWSAADRGALAADLAGWCDRHDDPVAAANLRNLAEQIFRSGVQTDPNAVGGLIRLLIESRRIDEAMVQLEQSTGGLPPPLVAALAAQLASRLGSDDALLPRLTSIVDRLAADAGAQNPQFWMLQASLLQHAGNYERAIKLLRQALERTPGLVLAANDLAILLALHAQQPDEGLRWIDRAIDQAGPLPWLLDTRATVLRCSKQYVESLQEMERAVGEETTPVRQFHLALARLETGHESQARVAFQAATAAGLGRDRLHPLERTDWDRLESMWRSPPDNEEPPAGKSRVPPGSDSPKDAPAKADSHPAELLRKNQENSAIKSHSNGRFPRLFG